MCDDNVQMMGGEVVEKDVEGWGFNYYIYEGVPEIMGSTMMMCYGPKTEKEIKARSCGL